MITIVEPILLVGPKAIGRMQVLHASDAFLMERFAIRGCVKIQISWKSNAQLSPQKTGPGMGIMLPPRISSLPSPLRTIFTPIALILRLSKYIGVLARTVVTSYVSR